MKSDYIIARPKASWLAQSVALINTTVASDCQTLYLQQTFILYDIVHYAEHKLSAISRPGHQHHAHIMSYSCV